MTEDSTYFDRFGVHRAHRNSLQNITLTDFSDCEFEDAHELAKAAFFRLIDGGSLEFSVPDFGQMISFYDHSVGVNADLREILKECEGKVWDERGIAKVLLESGFYKVWTGRIEGLRPCWMWVKALKFTVKDGAAIDGSEARPEGSSGGA